LTFSLKQFRNLKNNSGIFFISMDLYDTSQMSLFTSCKEGNIERVKELIEQGVNIAMCNNLALHLACEHGHISIVSLLLQDWRIEPRAYDNYAIITASQQGHTDIVKLLLQDGRADPTAGYNDAIIHACKNGHIKVVEALLQDGRTDPTDADNSAIGFASRYGHTDVVRVLLQDGRVDPADDNEWAIKFAATQEIKEMLINYRYRVDGPEYQKLKK
jgi:hypothetical protein